MSDYATLEASTALGEPFHLYEFAEGATVWRFAARAADHEDGASPANTWAASEIAHSAVVQSGDPRRVELDVSFAQSDAFARRFDAPRAAGVCTLTIHRAHAAVPGDSRVHWKGRVVSARREGERIVLRCESVFTSMRRQGLAAHFHRTCRHALYSAGCGVSLAGAYVATAATARAGLTYTVTAASGQADGYWLGGVLKHGDALAYITGHSGTAITIAAQLPELAAEVDGSPGTADVSIAPGCDLRRATCDARFANLANFGGFADIPRTNPFGGSSIV